MVLEVLEVSGLSEGWSLDEVAGKEVRLRSRPGLEFHLFFFFTEGLRTIFLNFLCVFLLVCKSGIISLPFVCLL